jgi:hypothetical protein
VSSEPSLKFPAVRFGCGSTAHWRVAEGEGPASGAFQCIELLIEIVRRQPPTIATALA